MGLARGNTALTILGVGLGFWLGGGACLCRLLLGRRARPTPQSVCCSKAKAWLWVGFKAEDAAELVSHIEMK